MTVRMPVGGAFVIGSVARVPHVPTRGGDNGERGPLDPLKEQRGVDRDVRLERGSKLERAVADAAGGATVGG